MGWVEEFHVYSWSFAFPVRTLSEQLAHSAVDRHLKGISEFFHGSGKNKIYTSVNRLINKEPSELLRLWLSEPIASESVAW